MTPDHPAKSSNSTSPSDWPPDRLRLVDVGGAGGLQSKWLGYADRMIPTLFEPNSAQAASLRGTLSETFESGLVVEAGLSNVNGNKDLHLTRYWGCTSLRLPNEKLLSKYRIASAFEVTGTASVSCMRYDALYRIGQVPVPDAIKVDVQGFEYEVLQGFGGLLDNCLGIEIEAHTYPIYQDQKLLHHLISFLADFGFVLRNLRPVPSFDGDVVELDAWFTKDITAWRQLDLAQKEKFRLICEVWDLIDYSRIDPLASHTHLRPA